MTLAELIVDRGTAASSILLNGINIIVVDLTRTTPRRIVVRASFTLPSRSLQAKLGAGGAGGVGGVGTEFNL